MLCARIAWGTIVLAGKTCCCFPFCPPSRAKNLNYLFFKIPKEKCRRGLLLGAIKRYVDREKENGKETAWQSSETTRAPMHLSFLSRIFLSALFQNLSMIRQDA